MKSSPLGLGIWIAWNGHATTDVDNGTLVEQALRAGAEWLCAKIGDDARSTRWLSRGGDLIARCKAAGLGIYTWNYSRPDTWASQTMAIAQVIAQGSMGHVIDAETEWEWVAGTGDHNFSAIDRRPAAASFMARLRAEIGDAFLAHAPIWRPQSHPGFPWSEFGSRCDAVMPQSYWCAAGQNVPSFAARLGDAWRTLAATHPEAVPLLTPIGLTYGAGDGWDQWTSDPHSLRLTTEDLRAFVERWPTCSFFSWDAANVAFWRTMNAIADERRAAFAGIGPVAADPSIDVSDRTPDTEPAPPDSAPTT